MTEEWRVVSGFGDYIVSNAGRVRHRRVGAPILKGSFDKDGYQRVCLNGCTLRVHTIVAEAFHGVRPEGSECAHLDGDPTNNCASNLAWVPHSENIAHKRVHGSKMNNGGLAGEAHPASRLAESQVAEIRASSLSSRKLAKEYGVSQSHIVRIKQGARWPQDIAQPSSGPSHD